MKVITIKQPFASLIVENIKKYEFRTWKTNYRGKILIHSAKTVDKNAMKKFEKYNLDCPTGCIIGIAFITDCIKFDDNFRNILKSENDLVYSNTIKNKEWNGYGFKLEKVSKIEPIKVRGKLSLWEYDYKD